MSKGQVDLLNVKSKWWVFCPIIVVTFCVGNAYALVLNIMGQTYYYILYKTRSVSKTKSYFWNLNLTQWNDKNEDGQGRKEGNIYAD